MEKAALPIENIIVILPPPKGEKTDSFVSVKAPGALLAARAAGEAAKQHFSTGYSKADRVKLNILLLLLFHFLIRGGVTP